MGNLPFRAATSSSSALVDEKSTSLAGAKRSLEQDASPQQTTSPLDEDHGAACTATRRQETETSPMFEQPRQEKDMEPQERPAKRVRRETANDQSGDELDNPPIPRQNEMASGLDEECGEVIKAEEDVWRLETPEHDNKVEDACGTNEDGGSTPPKPTGDSVATKVDEVLILLNEKSEGEAGVKVALSPESQTGPGVATLNKDVKPMSIVKDQNIHKASDAESLKQDERPSPASGAKETTAGGHRRSSRVRKQTITQWPEYDTPSKAKASRGTATRSGRKKTPKKTPKKIEPKSSSKKAKMDEKHDKVWEQVRCIRDGSKVLCRTRGCAAKAVAVWNLQNAPSKSNEWPLCAKCEERDFEEIPAATIAEQKDEKKRILSRIPDAVKERFGQVGFGALNGKGLKFVPALCLSPYQIPSGAARQVWMKEFAKFEKGSRGKTDESKFPLILYLYGENQKYGVVAKSNFISYKEAPRELEQYAAEAERKRGQGLQLSVLDQRKIKAMEELQDDLEKYANDGEDKLDIPEAPL